MTNDVFRAAESQSTRSMAHPCAVIQIWVSEGVFGANGPLLTDAAHEMAVLFMVAGEVDSPLNVGVSVCDLAPHVVSDFLPLVDGMPHLAKFIHLLVPMPLRTRGW